MVNKDKTFTDSQFELLSWNDLNDNSFTTDNNGYIVRRTITSGSTTSSGGTYSTILLGSEYGSYSFDASAQTITFSGLGTVTLEQLGVIVNATDGEVIYSPQDSSKGGTISSNVLTLDYDTTSMSDSDVLQIPVAINVVTDYTHGADKTLEINPDYAQWISVVHAVDETNLDAGAYRKIIEGLEDYRKVNLQLKGSGGVTFTVYATNDSTADDTADTGWIPITSSYYTTPITDTQTSADVDFAAERLMVKYETTDATNAVDVWYRAEF